VCHFRIEAHSRRFTVEVLSWARAGPLSPFGVREPHPLLPHPLHQGAVHRLEVVVSRNRIEPRSSRIAVVVVQQATEPFPPEHPSVLVRRRGRSLEQQVVETLVVPLTMVVGEVLADGPP
jgi:hypothetical protein